MISRPEALESIPWVWTLISSGMNQGKVYMPKYKTLPWLLYPSFVVRILDYIDLVSPRQVLQSRI